MRSSTQHNNDKWQKQQQQQQQNLQQHTYTHIQAPAAATAPGHWAAIECTRLREEAMKASSRAEMKTIPLSLSPSLCVCYVPK